MTREIILKCFNKRFSASGTSGEDLTSATFDVQQEAPLPS